MASVLLSLSAGLHIPFRTKPPHNFSGLRQLVKWFYIVKLKLSWQTIQCAVQTLLKKDGNKDDARSSSQMLSTDSSSVFRRVEGFDIEIGGREVARGYSSSEKRIMCAARGT
jgi:hypothetical protein